MRSHAKASTAGSTQRQAGRLGRFFRGADASRGISVEAKGSSRSPARRLVLPVGVFAALVALLVVAIPASATKVHLFKEVFGSAAQPSFDTAGGLAIDQSSGDVLVMDAGGTPSIERYNADGTADDFSATGTNVIDGQGSGDETPQNGLSFGGVSESQIAVDNSGTATDGNIYVTQGSPNLINIFSEDGEYLGQLTETSGGAFAEACGVAVDSSGAVYVGDYSGGIHKFVPAANPPVNGDNTASFSSVSQPCTLAAGAGSTAGFLFAAQYVGAISKLDSSTGEVKYSFSGNTTTLTVDPGTGHVYGVASATVDEFDVSGGSAVSASSVSLSNQIRGVAARGSSGDFYVSHSGTNKLDVFGPLGVVPGVSTGNASSITTTSATLNGTVDPDGVELSECRFEYGKASSYGQSVACAQSPATIGSGSGDVAVSADVSGLELGAEYHFRLVATNPNDAVNGTDQTFKLESPPVIEEAWAVGVTRKEATLRAKINPEGFATTYRIDYGTSASYGQSTATKTVGSDKADHVVSALIDGLQRDTTYHYRIVATNTIGVVESADQTFTTHAPIEIGTSCPNQAFRTGPASDLPDCRGYEMVSPVDKNGGDITSLFDGIGVRVAHEQSSVDGEKFTFSSYKAFADQPSSQHSNQYIASRGPDGWSTHGLNFPQGLTVSDPGFALPELFTGRFQAFTPDLSTMWVRDFNRTPLTSDALAGYTNVYQRSTSGDSVEALTIGQLLGPTPDGSKVRTEPRVQGYSDDLSHVIFIMYGALTADAPPTTDYKLYDYTEGHLELVGILPSGEVSNSPTYAGTSGDNLGHEGSLENVISDDGSRIFWTGEGAIFVRIDGMTTVRVSEGNAQWWKASADGSRAIYSEGNVFGGDADLFEFDVDTEARSLIAGESSGLLGASDDASYVYFTSREVLDSGASAGEPNVYLDHNGVVRFIATLSDADIGKAGPSSFNNSNTSSSPMFRTTRVTPDGRHIAFASTRSLTGYDNIDAVSGEADSEVFTYDADSGEVICASCNPSGARPVGKRGKYPYVEGEQPPGRVGLVWTAAWLPTWESELYGSRALSDDGNRLFFNSYDALLPQDTNGVQDVYQWEAQGAGTCDRAGGCVSLLSTGESPRESEFIDASASGDDVFLKTVSSLDSRDPGLVDIYDARVNGGFAPPPAPSPCIGDSCQSVPAAPNDPTPASAGFRGAGDPIVGRKTRSRCRAAREGDSRKIKRQAKGKKTKGCKRTKRRTKR